MNEPLKVVCGDANPSGNIQITYKGGCREPLNIHEAYRCASCGGWFHLDCLLRHFELEAGHDNARYYLTQIKKLTRNKQIIRLCDKGLEKQNKKHDKSREVALGSPKLGRMVYL